MEMTDEVRPHPVKLEEACLPQSIGMILPPIVPMNDVVVRREFDNLKTEINMSFSELISLVEDRLAALDRAEKKFKEYEEKIHAYECRIEAYEDKFEKYQEKLDALR